MVDKEYHRMWRLNNPDKAKARDKRYYDNHKEEIKKSRSTPKFKEDRRKWERQHNFKPDVIERNNLKYKKYNNKSSTKQKKKEWESKPEVKERRRIARTKPEAKQKAREYQEYYYSIPENKDNRDEWRKKHIAKPEVRQKLREADKRYNNTEKGMLNRKAKDALRRKRLRNVIHMFTKKEWIQKLKATKGICPTCNKFVGLKDMTMDHIYCIVKSSLDYQRTGIKRKYYIDDVQPMCGICNIKKWNEEDKLEYAKA